MRIKWISNSRDVPEVGILQIGQIKEVPDEIGKALVNNGNAEEIVKLKYSTKLKLDKAKKKGRKK